MHLSGRGGGMGGDLTISQSMIHACIWDKIHLEMSSNPPCIGQ